MEVFDKSSVSTAVLITISLAVLFEMPLQEETLPCPYMPWETLNF